MNALKMISLPNIPTTFAVSGGVDSMVLLFLAMQTIDYSNIFVAHFHHNLRWKYADRDYDFVRDFCQKNNIAFFAQKQNISEIAIQEKASIEATARKYRYYFLSEIYQKTASKSLVTAHHLDDRIETAMFNLIRGTKLSGLVSLKKSENRLLENQNSIHIFRPFLHISKSEILAFAKENSISFCTDETNFDNTLQRNFIRNEILPLFDTINPQYRKSFDNFLNYISDCNDFQNAIIADFLFQQNQKYASQRKKFIQKFQKNPMYIVAIWDLKKCEKYLQNGIIEFLFRQKNNGSFGFSEAVLFEILRCIFEGKNSFGVKKIKNFIMERRGDFVYFL